MQQHILYDIIHQIAECQGTGYSYIGIFANSLNKHREDFNIKNILVYQKMVLNDETLEKYTFCDNKRFNTDGLNLDLIASYDGVVDSRENDFSQYIDKGLGNVHIIAFPIHPMHDGEELIETSGVVVLMSYPQILLTSEDNDILYKLLQTQHPRALSCRHFENALGELLITETSTKGISIKDRLITIGRSLDCLAGKGDITSQEHGLRHFSFWSTDYSKDGLICKEFNKNTYNEIRHTRTPRSLSYDSNHFIAQYSKEYKDNRPKPFRSSIKLFRYGEVKECIIDCDYFKNIGITDKDSYIIIIPIEFDTQISYCCLYIKDILYSPFISYSLFEKLANAIRLRINFANETNIKNMLDKIMVASFTHNQSTDFFSKVSTILKECNEAEECLIYLRNFQGDKLLLVTEEDENKNTTYHENNMRYDQYGYYLPNEYQSSSLIKKHFVETPQLSNSFFDYCEENESIKSICTTIIKDANDIFCGFILLINNNHKTRNIGLFFNERFFYNNIYITKSCCNFLPLYLGFLHSNFSKTNLLKKLRHEIPQSTYVINRNITEIINKVDDRGFRIENFSKKAKELQINCKRIDTIASFFSTIDFDDSRFLEDPSLFNMRDFVNERIEIFREEAAYRGVYIRCNTEADSRSMMVSDYYAHAITNIITNAIRYAAPGTCIWIRSNSEEITVSDIGIPIKQSEMDEIFKEGYRSEAARAINERGMGYGLFLTERILSAYEHSLVVSCEEVYSRNIFAEKVVHNCISKLDPESRNRFVYKNTLLEEREKINTILHRMAISDSSIPHNYIEYLNIDSYSIDTWFSYSVKFGRSLWSMDNDILNNAIYKVIFSIKLPS